MFGIKKTYGVKILYAQEILTTAILTNPPNPRISQAVTLTEDFAITQNKFQSKYSTD